MSSSSVAEARRPKPTLTRVLHRHLWSGPLRSPAETVAFQRVAYSRACYALRAFYLLSAVWILNTMFAWPGLVDRKAIAELWPARWIQWVGFHNGIKLILVAYLAAALAVLAWPERRAFRLIYALVLLQYMAILNSPAKIDHNLHAWLYCAWIFVLLPDGGWARRQHLIERFRFLTVFAFAQFAVLFAYTLTGVWKVWEASLALAHGEVGGFSPSGFSYIVAERLLRVDAATVAGPFFVHHTWPGWLLYVGTMYLETASVLIAFRPRLHKLWGFGLIAFHLGTQLVMGITFVENVALLGLLFVFSPFTPERFDLVETLCDLPGVHIVAKRVRRRST